MSSGAKSKRMDMSFLWGWEKYDVFRFVYLALVNGTCTSMYKLEVKISGLSYSKHL